MFGYVSNVVSLVISLSFVVGPVTKVWTRIWLLVVPPYMNSCNLSYPSFTNLDQYPKYMYMYSWLYALSAFVTSTVSPICFNRLPHASRFFRANFKNVAEAPWVSISLGRSRRSSWGQTGPPSYG